MLIILVMIYYDYMIFLYIYLSNVHIFKEIYTSVINCLSGFSAIYSFYLIDSTNI